MVTSIGARLREERIRLKLSQVEFGSIAGVTKQAQIKYEKDERHPDTLYLASIAKAGVNVLYVLTGEQVQTASTSSSLAPDEEIMLDNFRHAPEAVQAGVKTTLGAFAPGTDSCCKYRRASSSGVR